jgi:dethiobiotin synthetase
MTQAYFVTGTDTGVGKTYVACQLLRHYAAQGLKVVGMKPVAAGREFVHGAWVHDDVQKLIAASNVVAPLELINPYCFDEAIAPHIAAQKAGVEIKIEVIFNAYRKLSQLADVVIVEGAGGFLVPLNDKETLADLVAALSIPVIMVVGIKLGCINHALLTAEAVTARGFHFYGWVANQLDPNMSVANENIATLIQRLQAAPMLTLGLGQAKNQIVV